MTASDAALAGNPSSHAVDDALRPSALREHRAGAFQARLRHGARRAAGRDRRHRGQRGGAHLRQHHRGAGAQRPDAEAGRRRVLQPRRLAHQRRDPGDRARDGAGPRQAPQQHLHERGAVQARRRRSTTSATASASPPSRPASSTATTPSSCAPARSSGRRRRSGSPRSRSGWPASARSSRRTCWPTRNPISSFSTARPISPGLPSFLREAAAQAAEERGPEGQARHHAVPLQHRAVPAILQAGATCASRPSRPGRRAATTAARPTTRRSSPRWWRCAPSGRSFSATRPSPISSSPTPWRRRRTPC